MPVQAEACTAVESTMGGLPGYPGSTDQADGVEGIGHDRQDVSAAPMLVLGVADWAALAAVKERESLDAWRLDALLGARLLQRDINGEIGLTDIGLEALIMKRAGFYKLLAKLLKSVGAADQPVERPSIWQRLRSRRVGVKAQGHHSGLPGSLLFRRRTRHLDTVDTADAG